MVRMFWYATRLWRAGLAQLRALSLFIGLTVLLAWPPPSTAQHVIDHPSGYTRSSWGQADGVPDYVMSMAQTPDGWLWLASRSELFRFDGVTAERYPIEAADGASVYTLLGAKNGDLWLGYSNGLTIRLPASDYAHPIVVRGLAGIPLQFLDDTRGVIWARTIDGLFQLKPGDKAWREAKKDVDPSARGFYGMAIGDDGVLWLLTRSGVFSRALDDTAFVRSNDLSVTMAWINQDDEAIVDQLYSYGNFYLVGLLSSRGIAAHSTGSHDTMILDSRHQLWSPSEKGIVMQPATGARQLATLVQLHNFGDTAEAWTSMSSSRVLSLLEDRRHNVWAGTVNGLEKFQKSLANTLALPARDLNFSMLPDEDGAILFGTAVSLRRNFQWWRADRTATPVPGFKRSATTVFRDRDGSVLIGTGDGRLERYSGQTFTPFEPLPPDAAQGDDMLAVARDGQGDLWASIVGHSTYRFRNGRWSDKGGLAALPNGAARRMVVDAAGRLWLAYAEELALIDRGKVLRFGPRTGMVIHNVKDVLPDPPVLVGGDDGLAAFDGRRFHRISATDPDVLTGITGMVRLADGTLWLNARQGAVRILPQELARALSNPSYPVAFRVFGEAEGMPGAAQPIRPVPSVIQGNDGRLWFANTGGLAWLNPALLPVNTEPPVTQIRRIKTAEASYRPQSLPMLKAGTRQLEFDYTALGLSDATRAHFRYRLTGVDETWQEAGPRRQAFYANLGPGSYTFQVLGSNEDGIWSTVPSVVTVIIAPFFYQTWWFACLCLLAIAGVLWGVNRLRVSYLMRRLRERLDDQHSERERIARELHDTYLQTVQNLILNIHLASNDLPVGAARDGILRTLDLADDALTEGRYRVRALRMPTEAHKDLAEALREIAQQHAEPGAPMLRVSTSGTPPPLVPEILEELYAGAREAIRNAFRHAKAREVRVDIIYSAHSLSVTISDDGHGITSDALNRPADNHWGIRGMRERMNRIGGSAEIIGSSGQGTTVILSVAASRFQPPSKPFKSRPYGD